MPSQSVILTFPWALVDKPVVSSAIRRFDIEVNILQASVMQSEEGRIFAILDSESREEIDKALDYFRKTGLDVILPVRNLVWVEERCISCGACTGQCPSGALTLNPESGELEFRSEKCIACELCIPSCSYAALESVSDHLERVRNQPCQRP